MFNKTKNKIKYQHKQQTAQSSQRPFPMLFPIPTIDHRSSTVDHRSSTIDHRPSVIATSFPIPFHDALAFPILWLSHRIRYLLLQTTDLPNTIDLLHQTTDDGIASTIPIIASDISFLRPPICLRPSTSPISTSLNFHSSSDQKRSPICCGSHPAQHSPICNGLGRLYIGRQYNRPSP